MHYARFFRQIMPGSAFKRISDRFSSIRVGIDFPLFDQIFELDKKFRLSLYVEGRTEQSFSRHLQGEQPYFVLITSNTATFPMP